MACEFAERGSAGVPPAFLMVPSLQRGNPSPAAPAASKHPRDGARCNTGKSILADTTIWNGCSSLTLRDAGASATAFPRWSVGTIKFAGSAGVPPAFLWFLSLPSMKNFYLGEAIQTEGDVLLAERVN